MAIKLWPLLDDELRRCAHASAEVLSVRHSMRGNVNQQDRNRIVFNGVDATDTNRPFSGQEWDQLGPNGRAYVMHERERLTGRTNN
jgi:hypothetical protein